MSILPSRIWPSLALAAAAAFLLSFTLPVLAQQSDPGGDAPKIGAGGKRVLTLDDYASWNRITGTSISSNGRWVTYTYSPNDGDATLFVKALDADTTYTIAAGSSGGGGRGGRGGGGGGGAQFSPDSRWIAYFVSPPASAGRGRGGRGGGRGAASGRTGQPAPRGPGGATGAGPAPDATRRLEIMDLATGEKHDVPNASGFQFSADSAYLAIKMSDAAGDTSKRGTDLLVRELATGTDRNIGNVFQYDFDDSGKWLAYSVDASGNLGNGVYVAQLATGRTRALDSAALDYDSLTWRPDQSGLLVLRGETPDGKALRENVLVEWPDVTSDEPAKVVWNPAETSTVPDGYILSEYAAPRWSTDGSRVFVGIKAQADAREPGDPAEQANVDVWHWQDVDLQSEQMIGINQARRTTLSGAVTLASGAFVQLADERIPTITPTADDRWAIGRDATPYAHDFSEGNPARADFYKIDTTTGARTLIAKKLLRTMGTSPDGQWFLYLRDGHVMAFNLADHTTVNVDKATGKSFVNTDFDQAAEKPIWGVAGWTDDGRSVLLNDKFDIWSMPLDPAGRAKGAPITGGLGAAEQIVFRLASLQGGGGGRGGGRGGGAGGGADEGIDLTKPQTLSAYGEWTKKSGYWSLPAGGGTPTPLIWADKQIGGAVKADEADRVIFTEQTFEEFPDYWVSDGSFAAPRKVTDASPQLAEYAWGRKVLVDYANSKGTKLQATLTLPAGYEPGRKYPMLVYIYEKMSNTHHQFSMPVYDDRPHMSAYASDGYLVLQPDIVYEIGKPGTSALDCVTAAVKKVIDLGYADPAHIGLQGHSWGGYESSFIVTQTNMFAAVVTGAPLTNLISMYDILYKQSGNWNGGILETSQGRMGANVTPSNAHDIYERESPIYHVTKIQTPLLIMQGTADGAVDWNQGLEYYTSARRNGKNVIFLSYPDEPHHLARRPNQKDFQIRMKQYFDHYLKGGPMPDWMKTGVPQTEKGGANR